MKKIHAGFQRSTAVLFSATMVFSICWSPCSLAAPEFISLYGPGDCSLEEVAASGDGSIAGVGVYDTPSASSDAAILLFDPAGNLSVSTAWGGSGSDGFGTALFTDSGDILCGGSTTSFGVPVTSQLLMRISNEGSPQWAHTLMLPTDSGLSGIDRSPAGDFFTCGGMMGTPLPMDIIVSRISDSGVVQWCTALHNWYFSLWVRCIEATSDGGCIITGSTGSTGSEYLVIFKFLPDGSLDWSRFMGFTSYIGGVSIHEVTDGFMMGVIMFYPASSSGLVKLNSSGELVWARAYSQSESPVLLNCLSATGDGGYAGAGMILVDGSSSIYECLIFRTSATGTLEWAYRIGDQLDGDDIGNGMAVLPSGEIAIAGYRKVYTPIRSEMLMIRTRSDGVIPGCDLIEPISLIETDITSEIGVYTRNVTVSSMTPTVTDVTASIVMQAMDLTETVHCNGILVPALSGAGLLVLLILTGILIRKNR